MKRPSALALAALTFVIGCLATVAYNSRSKARTVAPPLTLEVPAPRNDRFQIIQSPLMARLTFKLDSYTGDVWQLVVDKRSVLKWEPLPVLSLERATSANEIRFQIFVSKVLAKNTFLVDLQTGLTWILTSSKDSGFQWEPMETLPQ